jgi:ATP-dependent protease ClpP protease subunit
MTEPVLRLYGVIGDEGLTAAKVAEFLAGAADATAISVRINSAGGYVGEGLAIHNLLARSGKKVAVQVDGIAASMASVVAMAGADIVIAEGAVMMIHDPWMITMGDAGTLRAAAGSLDAMREEMAGIYAKRTRRPQAQVSEAMLAETWFTSAQAVDWGLADRLDPTPEIKPAQAMATVKLDHLRLAQAPAAIAELIRAGATRSVIKTGKEAQEKQMSHPSSDVAEVTAPQPQASVQAPSTARGPSAEEIVSAERARARAIRETAGKLDLPVALADRLIDDGVPIEQARAALIDERAKAAVKAAPDAPTGAATVRVQGIGLDESNRGAQAEAMAKAIVHRHDPHAMKLDRNDLANAYTGWTLLDMAGDRMGMKSRNRHELARAAVHSTSDFPFILENSLNKQLQARYQTAGRTYQAWAAARTFRDFRAHPEMRAGDFPALKVNGENAPIEYGTSGESKESIAALKYARRFGISFEMIVNDDLGAFLDVAAAAGERAGDFENALVYAVLSANSGAGANLRDGSALFLTARGNIAASGAAISVASIALGRAAMRKQTSIDGIKLNLAPRVLVCGPDKETEAEQVLMLAMDPTTDGATNPFKNKVQVVADANVAGNKWYLFASPTSAPVVKYGYLEGYTGPRVETMPGWSTVGIEYRMMLFFGCGAVDFRGGYYNAGA